MKILKKYISLVIMFFLVIDSVTFINVKANTSNYIDILVYGDVISSGESEELYMCKDNIFIKLKPHTDYQIVSAKAIIDGKDEYEFIIDEDKCQATIPASKYADEKHTVEVVAIDYKKNEYKKSQEFLMKQEKDAKVSIEQRDGGFVKDKAKINVSILNKNDKQKYVIDVYVNWVKKCTAINELNGEIDFKGSSFKCLVKVVVKVDGNKEIFSEETYVYRDPLEVMSREQTLDKDVLQYNDRYVVYGSYSNDKYVKDLKDGSVRVTNNRVGSYSLADTGMVEYNSQKGNLVFYSDNKDPITESVGNFFRVGQEIIFNDKKGNIVSRNINTQERKIILDGNEELISAEEGSGILFKRNNSLYCYDGTSEELVMENAGKIRSVSADNGTWFFVDVKDAPYESGILEGRPVRYSNTFYMYANGQLKCLEDEYAYGDTMKFTNVVINGKLYYTNNNELFVNENGSKTKVTVSENRKVYDIVGRYSNKIKTKDDGGNYYYIDVDSGKIYDESHIPFVDDNEYRYENIINGEKYFSYDNSIYKINDGKKIEKEDVNSDENIDLLDLALIGEKYNLCTISKKYDSRVDLNKDGIIDVFDLCLVGNKIYN